VFLRRVATSHRRDDLTTRIRVFVDRRRNFGAAASTLVGGEGASSAYIDLRVRPVTPSGRVPAAGCRFTASRPAATGRLQPAVRAHRGKSRNGLVVGGTGWVGAGAPLQQAAPCEQRLRGAWCRGELLRRGGPGRRRSRAGPGLDTGTVNAPGGVPDVRCSRSGRGQGRELPPLKNVLISLAIRGNRGFELVTPADRATQDGKGWIYTIIDKALEDETSSCSRVARPVAAGRARRAPTTRATSRSRCRTGGCRSACATCSVGGRRPDRVGFSLRRPRTRRSWSRCRVALTSRRTRSLEPVAFGIEPDARRGRRGHSAGGRGRQAADLREARATSTRRRRATGDHKGSRAGRCGCPPSS